MPTSADAKIGEEQGRTTLRFERILDHSPDRVFAALSRREQLDAWHPSPFEIEPAVGGAVSYVRPGDAAPPADGEVLEHDPPRLLSYTWFEDVLRWELRPHDRGCLLLLTHVFDDRMKAARDAAGWHICLAALETSLGGEIAPAPSQPHQRLPQGWSELNAEYQQRFAIPPEKATPPPQL